MKDRDEVTNLITELQGLSHPTLVGEIAEDISVLQNLSSFLLKESGGSAPYVAKGVVPLDASINFSRIGNLAGVVNGYTGLMSFWIKIADFEASVDIFAGTSDFNFFVGAALSLDRDISCSLFDPTGVHHIFLNTKDGSGGFVVSSGVWHNVIFSFDTNHPAGEKILQTYLDGVSCGTVPIDNNPAFLVEFDDPTSAFWEVDNSGDSSLELSDFYWAPNQFLDLTNPNNVAKFISEGKPVSLGVDGSLPTGTAPAIFFSGDASTFGQPNLGSGGDFTLTGTLIDASTSPSD